MQNYTELQIADDSAVVNKSDIFLNRCNDRLFAQYPKNYSSSRKGEGATAVIFIREFQR